ncbi:MAG: WD40 repeat domain-containing protein [Phycisphaerales bacterium JB059]
MERIKYSDAINAFVLLLRDGRLLSIAAGDATPNDMGTLDPGYHDMALVNDGRTAAIIAGSPRELVFVNLVEGAQSATDGLYAGSIAGVPGGSRVIASNHDRELDTVGADMVDAESGEVLRRMSFSKNVAGELALTEGGRLGVFTPTYSRLVGAIDLTRGGASHIVGAHDEEYVTCVVQAPGGLAVSGDSKGIVRLWDPERAEGSSFVRLKDAFLSDVTSDPNGKLLAICGRNDNRVLLLDLATGGETALWDLASSAGYVSSLAFSADAALACVMYSRGRVEVRSVPRGELVRTICEDERASTSYTLRADFSADGRWLAVPDTTGRVRTWSVPGLDLAGEFFIDDASVYQAVFSPDSETLVAAWKRTDDGAGGGVVAWDHDSLRELLRMDSNMGLTAVEFDPQRSRFVVGGFGGECWIYDLETKQRTDLVGMGKERVATIAFTPDGQRVIGTGHISKAIVWDADSGLNLLAIPGPSTGYHTNDLDIASDGTLITCGGNVVQIHPNASPRSAATWQGPEGSRP